MTLRIDGRLIGPGHRTLVIAEIGVNHDGSVERAVQLVHHAAAAGADAVKLQIFRADALMHASSQFATYQIERSTQDSPAAMLRELELTTAEIGRVVEEIRALRLLPLATPFSSGDVAIIEELGFPAIKIASPDLVNRLLLQRCVATDKPMILSTGAAEMTEVSATIDWLNRQGVPFAMMHCVSSYPTPAYQAHLCWLQELAALGVTVGYSDHTTELFAGAFAVSAGACVVEKHLTYDRNASGPDHAASAGPAEFGEYVRLIRAAEALRGTGGKHVLPIERDVRTVSRQSLVLKHDLQPGQIITADDCVVQRPGSGISPALLDEVSKRPARLPLKKGTLLQWDMLADAA